MKSKIIVSAVLFLVSSFVTFQVCAKEITVSQKDKSFVIDGKKVDKYEIKQGDVIHFVNQDPWFHNIFSLSDIKTFDLGSYQKGESRNVTFSQLGKIEIECAIHPAMFIEVDVQ